MSRKFAAFGLFSFVVISAALAQPSIYLWPSAVDFGFVEVGSSSQQAVVIANAGDELLVGDVTISGGAFTLVGNAHFEVEPNIDPRDTICVVSVLFQPPLEGNYTGEITVTSNDPYVSQITVPMTGIGAGAPPIFTLLEPNNNDTITLPTTFTWEALDVTTEVEYELNIMADSGVIRDPLMSFYSGPNTFYTLHEGELPVDGYYVWWVVARWEDGACYSQETRTFLLDGTPPPSVIHLLSPQDEMEITTDEYLFEWEPTTSVYSYQLAIRPEDTPPSSPPLLFDAGRATSFTLNTTELSDNANYRWFVVLNSVNGVLYSADEWTFSLNLGGIPQAASELANGIPGEFRIETVYPNPFNPQTAIQLSVPVAGEVEAVIFDVMGREAATLINGYLPAGHHRLTWRPEGPAGVYFLNVRHASGVSDVQKLLFIK